MKSLNLDLITAFKSFFKLKDLATRTLILTGVYFLGFIIVIISILIFLVPTLGSFLGCLAISVSVIFFILFSAFLKGYKFDLIKSSLDGNSIEDVKLETFTKTRINNSIKISLAFFIYQIPSIILYVLAFILMFLPYIILGEDINENDNPTAILGIILSIIPFCLAWIYQMLQKFILCPNFFNLYYKNKEKITLFDSKKTINFIKLNWLNLITYSLILYVIQMGISLITNISFYLIFICIGLVIHPLVSAFVTLFQNHFEANLIGQMIKNDKS